MSESLRVLIVEDSPPDAELLLRELRRGYQPSHRRVDSERSLRAALLEQEWDLILCDFTMAGFSGTEALSIVRREGLDVPLIFVSGTIGEETAVAAMRAGAQDYIVKDNLRRLLPAIERELRDAALRREAAIAGARWAAAELRFQDLLAMAPDAIVAIDEERGITIFNRAAEGLFGYAAAEVMGAPLTLLLVGEAGSAEAGPGEIGSGGAAAGGSTQPLPAGHAGPPAHSAAVLGRRRTGETFPAEASFSRSHDGGRPVRLAVIRDVSRRRELEEQLRQSQKMEVVGQLTGGLAHDFNNLLTVIIGNLEALQATVPEGSRSRRMTDLALNASLRGATLTRQMLAFSRRQPLEARAFDLNGLVASTIGLLHRTLGDHIAVRTRLPPGLPPAFADPAQVETALLNLALNARDAMAGGGRLTIETTSRTLAAGELASCPDLSPGVYLLLSVADTGSGIAPENLARVFEPFFTTKQAGLGTGLGLSMVYGFARQSGGHVAIASAPGAGTTVQLFLPRAEGRAEPAPATPATPAQLVASHARILVVEDDEDVRATAVALLAGMGFDVVEAPQADAALDLLRQGPQVDLLFTDLAMPGGMSGIGLAEAARQIDPSIRVLIASGYADLQQLHGAPAAQSGGIAAAAEPELFLNKPYRRAELLEKVRQALGQDDPPA